MASFSGEESFVILGDSSQPPSVIPNGASPEHLSYNNVKPETEVTSESLQLKELPEILSGMVVDESDFSNGVAMIDSSHRMSDILEENQLLRQMLKENNKAMKEQFEAIEQWRDDVMEAQRLHKIKFAEMKELIKKLKTENKNLKVGLQAVKSNKATNLRITNNVNDISIGHNEADDHKIISTYQCVSIDNTMSAELENVKEQIKAKDKENCELRSQNASMLSVLEDRERQIEEYKEKIDNEYECKISSLQGKVKECSIKLLEAENIKLSHTLYKEHVNGDITNLNMQIKDLRAKLKDTLRMAINPLRTLVEVEKECIDSNYDKFAKNVKIFDDILKQITVEFNNHIEHFSTLFTQLSKMIAINEDDAKTGECSSIRSGLDNCHKDTAEFVHKFQSAVADIKMMFVDYKNVLKYATEKKIEAENYSKKVTVFGDQLEIANTKLISISSDYNSSEKEMKGLRKIVETLQKESEERDLMRAQLEIYKVDFESERNARTEIAAEKQTLIEQLSQLQRRNQMLQSDALQRNSPSTTMTDTNHTWENIQDWIVVDKLPNERNSSPIASYECPLCQKVFRTAHLLQIHVDTCID